MQLNTDGTQHSRLISTAKLRLSAWKFAADQFDMTGKPAKLEARFERVLNEAEYAALRTLAVWSLLPF
jgi:hypothetical protein